MKKKKNHSRRTRKASGIASAGPPFNEKQLEAQSLQIKEMRILIKEVKRLTKTIRELEEENWLVQEMGVHFQYLAFRVASVALLVVLLGITIQLGELLNSHLLTVIVLCALVVFMIYIVYSDWNRLRRKE